MHDDERRWIDQQVNATLARMHAHLIARFVELQDMTQTLIEWAAQAEKEEDHAVTADIAGRVNRALLALRGEQP